MSLIHLSNQILENVVHFFPYVDFWILMCFNRAAIHYFLFPASCIIRFVWIILFWISCMMDIDLVFSGFVTFLHHSYICCMKIREWLIYNSCALYTSFITVSFYFLHKTPIIFLDYHFNYSIFSLQVVLC